MFVTAAVRSAGSFSIVLYISLIFYWHQFRSGSGIRIEVLSCQITVHIIFFGSQNFSKLLHPPFKNIRCSNLFVNWMYIYTFSVFTHFSPYVVHIEILKHIIFVNGGSKFDIRDSSPQSRLYLFMIPSMLILPDIPSSGFTVVAPRFKSS